MIYSSVMWKRILNPLWIQIIKISSIFFASFYDNLIYHSEIRNILIIPLFIDHSWDLHFESKILFWLIFCILDHVLHIFVDSDQNPGSTNVADSDPDPETDIRMFFFSQLWFILFSYFLFKTRDFDKPFLSMENILFLEKFLENSECFFSDSWK